MMSATIDVLIRRTTSAGKKKVKIHLETQPPTLAEVKNKVIRRLQPSWNQGITLQQENIKVFRVRENETKEVSEDHELLDSAAAQFVAVEYFTSVPEDLFRTIKLSELELATFSHPDHAFSAFTKVSPLLCAGYQPEEQKFPWFSSTGMACTLMVHGVSLRSWNQDEKHNSAIRNPFQDDIGEYEETGDSFMTLEEYKESVGETCYDEHFGILQSNCSHIVDESGIGPKADKIKKANKKISVTTGPKLATERLPLFRFKLKKFLDLAEYGVALVYDNSTMRHVSLVRIGRGSNYRNWRPHKDLLSEIRMPTDCWGTYDEVQLDELALKDLLRNEVFQLKEGKEPETIRLSGVKYLPKVASLFALHDINMKASAEPRWPLSDDNDDNENHKIYEGALVLYHLDLGWDVVLSIEALEKANYVVKDLDESFRDILMETFSEGMPDLDDVENILDWDFEYARNAIEAIRDALIYDSSEVTGDCDENPHTPPRPRYGKQTRLSPFFKKTPDQQKQSDQSKKDCPKIDSASTAETTATPETPMADSPKEHAKGMEESMLEMVLVGLEEDVEETV